MPPGFRRLAIGWIVLLLLFAIELGASFAPIPPWQRTWLLLPAIAMAVILAVVFMEIGRGPVIVRGFAAAAVVWLTILLGLGSMDPLTRTDYHLSDAHRP